MSRLPVVAAAHWFVMVSFGLLFLTLVTAFGQLFSPSWALPLIGHFFLLEWVIEAIAWLSLVGILTLIAIRQKNHPRRADGDGAALAVLRLDLLAGLLRRGDDPRRRPLRASRCGRWSTRSAEVDGETSATALHYPLTAWLGALLRRLHRVESRTRSSSSPRSRS